MQLADHSALRDIQGAVILDVQMSCTQDFYFIQEGK